MKKISTLAAVGGIALLTAASMTLGSQEVIAADHAEAPGTQADAAADIADFFAWHTEDGKIVAIVTFAGLQQPGDDGSYDRDVLYTVHIDNTGAVSGLTPADPPDPTMNGNDNESDIQINIRFGQNGFGDWGYQVEGLPGVADTMQAAVGEMIDGGDGNIAQAGTYDDPFSFDADGFDTTLENTATDMGKGDVDVAFSSLAGITMDPPVLAAATDRFAGTNVHAIVLEFDAAAALNKNPDGLVQMWATTSRISE